jgi:hypothetical protein
MLLDGVMVLTATTCMTVMHPGYAFGKRWADASFPFVTPKDAADTWSVNRWLKKIPILRVLFPNAFGHDTVDGTADRRDRTEDHGIELADREGKARVPGEKTEPTVFEAVAI